MGLGEVVKRVWSRGEAKEGERKTSAAGWTIFTPAAQVKNTLPKPTAANLRRFAEVPVARRAINCVKDRVACMGWTISVRQDVGSEGAADRAERARALRRALEAPNEGDSFRTMIEAVIEDVLVGGFGAVEMEATGDEARPVRLYPVDGRWGLRCSA